MLCFFDNIDIRSQHAYILSIQPLNTHSHTLSTFPWQCLERFLAVSLRHEGNDGMNTMKASDKLGTYYYLIAYTLPVNGQPVQLSQVTERDEDKGGYAG